MKRYRKEDIEQLLAKFMDGETTIAEEDVLAGYFKTGDVPEEWADYEKLFRELADMKPVATAKPHPRRWMRWAAAAVVAVGVSSALLTPWQNDPPQQVAHVVPPDDVLPVRTDTLRPEAPNEEPLPDTVALPRQLEQKQKAPTPRRRLRKPEPTQLDYDKAYVLMAKMQQEREDTEQMVAHAKLQVVYARLTAAGYIPVMEEDGTIVYIKEEEQQQIYIAYEE